ncbi:MAG: hypothetical protein GY757_32165 [bacterium]|nr:hypothetical protein [bacterium]
MLKMGLLWSPVIAAVVLLLKIIHRIQWPDAIVLASPPMVIQLFISLSTWYLCRLTFMNRWALVKTMWTHFSAVIVLNALWMLLFFLYSALLDFFSAVKKWGDLFSTALPVFLSVGFALYFIAILAHYLVLAVDKNRKTEQEVLEQKLMAARVELNALKTTVHPHFLFNCLNMLSPLIRTSSEKALVVVSQLSDFLIYSLKYGNRELVPLREELENIENYLGIESVRFGERLTLHFDVDEKARDVQMLPLALLPLVENAIKHGISLCLDGGTLSISIKLVSSQVQITVTNPFEIPSRPIRGSGLGLDTLKRRLALFYDGRGALETSSEGSVFSVRLIFPQDPYN